MKTRDYDWYDSLMNETLYSFQVYHLGRWHNVHDNGKLYAFKTAQERDVARKEFEESESE